MSWHIVALLLLLLLYVDNVLKNWLAFTKGKKRPMNQGKKRILGNDLVAIKNVIFSFKFWIDWNHVYMCKNFKLTF